MAVRNESVRLSLDDQFSSGMARAAAATALLKKELDGLDGKRVSRDLDDTSRSVDRFGSSSGKAGPAVDKFSGRLRLLADAAVTLGPALIPLGASTIPVLTASLAGLGAAAGGIGVALLAFNGLGDALKTIDAYQLEPTVANLQAMQVAMEKLGPAGAHFAKFLDDLEPQLSNLQMIAREGMFPGLEAGISDMLTRLPLVQGVVKDIAEEMGRLAEDSGRALAGDDWTPFFEYIQRNAAPIMDDFARSTGNVALGLANLLVAFEPVTRDFTSGLLEMSRSFADWSKTLDTNQGFQAFMDEVQSSGPQVLDFLGSLVDLFAGIVKAAAPWGNVLLPALTATADVLATIANSPIGPALYTGAAAMVLFGRSADVASKSVTRLQTSIKGISAGNVIGALGLLGASLTSVDDNLGLSNTAMLTSAGLMVGGPWGAALGASAGLVTDFAAAQRGLNDELATTRDIIQSNDIGAITAEYERLKGELDDTGQAQADFFRNGQLNFSADAIRGWVLGTQAQEEALSELGGAMSNTGGLADLFAHDMGLTADQMTVAAGAADDLSGALAGLNGWFDKRQAVRDYKASIDDLSKSLRDGFQPKDVETLDNLGRNILKVVNLLPKGQRSDFLAAARANMVDLATKSGPKAAAAIQDIIDKFDSKGLTHPPPIVPTVDDSRARAGIDDTAKHVKTTLDFMSGLTAKPKVTADTNPFSQLYKDTTGKLSTLDRTTATPKVTADAGNALDIIGNVARALHDLNGDTATTYVTTIHTTQIRPGTSVTEPHAAIPRADGGSIPGKRFPYGDKMLIMAAPGEEVISNRFGQADRFRADRASGRIPGYANGGSVGGNPFTTEGGGGGGGNWTAQFTTAAQSAAVALQIFQQELKASEKALSNEKNARDATVSAMASLSGSVSGKFNLDLGSRPANVWAPGSGGILSQIRNTTSQAQAFPGIVAALKAAGLTGSALAEVLQEMDFGQLQALAADPSQAGQIGTALGGLYSAQQVAGDSSAQAVYGEELKAQTKELRHIQNEVRELRKDVRQADKNNQQAQKDNSHDVGQHVNGAASNGHRRGK